MLATLTDERANGGEIRNAAAVICLAEGDPAAALTALQDVLDGVAPVVGYVTNVETVAGGRPLRGSAAVT